MFDATGSDWGHTYKRILNWINYKGTMLGKSKTLFNLYFEVDPDQVLILPQKNWKWAFTELYDRFDSKFENPGTSVNHRPHWQRKLEAEGGKFCYTYNERLWPALWDAEALLKRNKYERDAVVTVFNPGDIVRERLPRSPCTIGLHFYSSDKETLNLQVTMRANDVVNLLIYDVFHHSMLLRWMASRLKMNVGTYQHFSTIAYYQKKREERGYVERLLKEDIKYYKIDPIEDFETELNEVMNRVIKVRGVLIKSKFMSDLSQALFCLKEGQTPRFKTEFFKEAIKCGNSISTSR
jgi:hypothetical protein